MAGRALVIFLVFVFLLTFPSQTLAHPGRTAADGCHYCRTNCDKWGVPWNQRHCHGGVVLPPQTSKPTPTEIPSPTPEPTVQGEATGVPTPTPITAEFLQKNGPGLGLIVFIVLIGLLGYRWFGKRFVIKRKEEI